MFAFCGGVNVICITPCSCYRNNYVNINNTDSSEYYIQTEISSLEVPDTYVVCQGRGEGAGGRSRG